MPEIWDDELHAKCQRAAHVVTRDNHMLRGGQAMMYALAQIGWAGGFVPRVLAMPPLIWFIEIGYKIVARNRKVFSKIFFRHQSDAKPEILP